MKRIKLFSARDQSSQLPANLTIKTSTRNKQNSVISTHKSSRIHGVVGMTLIHSKDLRKSSVQPQLECL